MSRGVLRRSSVLAHRVASGESWCAGLSSWFDGLTSVANLSRRHFLQLSTLGASTLLPASSGLHVARSRGRIAFLLGGKECWVIDERYFAGRPRLRYSRPD